MYTEYFTHYSHNLERDMHMMIYGHDGLPFLCFPCQDSMCHNFEEFGMIAELRNFIDDGRIRMFVVDSVDKESWSKGDWDKARRSLRQEQYYNYIVEEAYPAIMERTGGRQPVTTGMSMGANHAAILFLRRPDLFAGMLSLSGVFDSNYFFDGYMDEKLYMNSPERFLPNMPADHPYIDLYNQKQIIFCVGQGAWEWDGVRTLRFLQSVFEEKGIHAWFDYWGYDVNHDWPWWYKQMRYFIPILLERL